MRKLVLPLIGITVLVGVWMLLSTAKGQEWPEPARAEQLSAVAHATNDFGFRLLAQMRTSDTNVILSPTSLSMALA